MAEGIESKLMSMIEAEFTTSHNHKVEGKGFFCFECGAALTTRQASEHQQLKHKVFQALKASNHYSYKREDISGLKVLKVSDIRAFAINKHKVYFQKSRSSDKGKDAVNKGCPGYCVTCGFKIDKPALYCSIKCRLTCNTDVKELAKLRWLMRCKKDGKVKKNGVKKKKRGRLSRKIKHGGVKKSPIVEKRRRHVEARKILKRLLNGFTNGDCAKSFRKRSRKGVPHRAPFF